MAVSAKAAPAKASAGEPASASPRAAPTRALQERTPSLPSADVEVVSLLPPGGDEGFAQELAEPDGFDGGTDQSALVRRQTEPAPAPGPAAASDASDRLFDDEVSNPTAMGDLRPVSPRAGAPEGGADEEDQADPGEAEALADQLDEGGDEERDLRRDDSRVAGTRPVIHDERTAALPPLSDAPTGPAPKHAADEDEEDADDDEGDEGDEPGVGAAAEPEPAGEDAEGFEVELRTAALEANVHGQPTGPAPAPAIAELPSDALQPLPSSVLGAPPPPARATAPAPPPPYVPPASYGAPSPSPPPPLPGQALAKPTAPTRPGVAAPAVGPGTPRRPPTLGAGLVAPRPSQQSKVPFEQARKAEKIYEQAIKDHAEGRLSSARMNVKLAVMYDPTVPAYQDFLNELDRAGAGAKSPNAGKSRELLLFEQASEAEGKGDYEGAVELLEQAIEIAPRAAALHNRIGVVLSVRLKRHEEALAHLRTAVEIEAGNIVFMNNYSKVTAMLDSELEKAPEKSKGKGDRNEKIAIKKMRPKMF